MGILSRMKIIRQSLLSGAASCRGTAVIIDVFRAFTCSSILVHFGTGRLLLEEDPARVLQLKESRGYIALGEIDGVMVEGFNVGNSPSEIIRRGSSFFRGRTVVQRTSAGVRGVFTAVKSCRRVFAASYTTAHSLARAILEEQPGEVHLVAMGESGVKPTPEDEYCASYINHLLDPEIPYDHLEALSGILAHESALKFLRDDSPHFPSTDVVYCLQRDIFDLAMEVSLTDDGLELRALKKT